MVRTASGCARAMPGSDLGDHVCCRADTPRSDVSTALARVSSLSLLSGRSAVAQMCVTETQGKASLSWDGRRKCR